MIGGESDIGVCVPLKILHQSILSQSGQIGRCKCRNQLVVKAKNKTKTQETNYKLEPCTNATISIQTGPQPTSETVFAKALICANTM